VWTAHYSAAMDANDSSSPPIRCPDCGHLNARGSDSCEQCNFPLHRGAEDASTKPAAASQADAPRRIEPPPRLRRLREKRKVSGPPVTLWLVIGVLAVLSLLYVAVQGFHQSNFKPVEGAKPDQQARADQMRTMIEKDSTDVAARIGLADVLYDTGNWSEAIIHYRAALRMDSTRVEALVDLGVCYYNLGFTSEAQRNFELALTRNPQQTVALFNLGILSERRHEHDEALSYFHRALQTNPPEDMKTTIVDAISRVQAETGAAAPPLPGGG
jgi:tetratricopeptide (TPR) repeat protein